MNIVGISDYNSINNLGMNNVTYDYSWDEQYFMRIVSGE